MPVCPTKVTTINDEDKHSRSPTTGLCSKNMCKAMNLWGTSDKGDKKLITWVKQIWSYIEIRTISDSVT